MSPSGSVTVPSGPLTIYGISSDTSKTNCRVYVDWNDLKPMKNVTAKGLSGENDYSNWTYTYTEKYHTIAPGINELTSKITCFDNPNNITSKYYSINITGLKNNTVSPTLPSSSSNITFGYHNLGYLPQYDGFYHDIFQPIIRDESPVQVHQLIIAPMIMMMILRMIITMIIMTIVMVLIMITQRMMIRKVKMIAIPRM